MESVDIPDDQMRALLEKLQQHHSLNMEISLINGVLMAQSFEVDPDSPTVQVTGAITVYAFICTYFKPNMKHTMDALFKGLSKTLIFDYTDIDEVYISKVNSEREICEIYIITKDQH